MNCWNIKIGNKGKKREKREENKEDKMDQRGKGKAKGQREKTKSLNPVKKKMNKKTKSKRG